MTTINVNGWLLDTGNPYHDKRTFAERKAERIDAAARYHRNAFNQAMAQCERNRVLARRRVREGNMIAAKFYQSVSADWYREAVKHQFAAETATVNSYAKQSLRGADKEAFNELYQHQPLINRL